MIARDGRIHKCFEAIRIETSTFKIAVSGRKAPPVFCYPAMIAASFGQQVCTKRGLLSLRPPRKTRSGCTGSRLPESSHGHAYVQPLTG